MDLPIRPRRNRRTAVLRDLVRETDLGVERLVQPLFLHDDPDDVALTSLPGQTRWSLDGLVGEVGRLEAVGVRSVVLFPKVDEALRTRDGAEAHNPDGVVPRAVAAIKDRHPDVVVMTDVALDPYSSDGHDGLVDDDGRIVNDETVDVLVLQAIAQARAGADVIAPSDMMDGRVGAIRTALDAEGFAEVSILAYTAKYASSFYGPFRGALDSAPKEGDKSTYQMDPGNVREALRELQLDVDEGADMVMVKPAGPYLDVVAAVAAASPVPVAAYQVSGEYLMLAAAAEAGWLDRDAAVLESLLGIRRAGADLVLTYWAGLVAELLA